MLPKEKIYINKETKRTNIQSPSAVSKENVAKCKLFIY